MKVELERIEAKRDGSEDGSLSAGQENRAEQNRSSIEKLEGELAEIARGINEGMGNKGGGERAAKKRVKQDMEEEDDDFYDRTGRGGGGDNCGTGGDVTVGYVNGVTAAVTS